MATPGLLSALCAAALSVLAPPVTAIAIGVARGEASELSEERSFIRKVNYKYTLRVCNAYPHETALDVYHGTNDIKLTGAPMAYRQCEDFSPLLRSGDRIDFKAAGASAGTFTISELPASDAVLLLVISRHDAASTAVSFQSHIFTATEAPQIAVLDAFKGKGQSGVRIRDQDVKPPAGGSPSGVHELAAREEQLRYGSVVAVDPGAYNVQLWEAPPGSGAAAPKPRQSVPQHLEARPRGAYAIVRIGLGQAGGSSPYTEELLVFPQLKSLAVGSTRLAALAALAVVLVPVLGHLIG